MNTEAAPTPCSERRKALFGLLVRKPRWGLSWTAWLILAAAFGTVTVWMRCESYLFLSPTDRLGGEYLVVEGWIPAYGLKEAKDLFDKGGYRKVIVSGCVAVEELKGNPRATYADWGAGKLQLLGMNTESIQPVPCYVLQKDRTYNSAVAVRDWFEQNKIPVAAIDVVSMGAHSRRSRLMYEKAFHDMVKVGIFAVEDRGFDPSHWWRTSEGVREVLGETIAYFYARFFFSQS